MIAVMNFKSAKNIIVVFYRQKYLSKVPRKKINSDVGWGWEGVENSQTLKM